MEHPTGSQKDGQDLSGKGAEQVTRVHSLEVGQVTAVNSPPFRSHYVYSDKVLEMKTLDSGSESKFDETDLDTAIRAAVNHRRLNPRQIQLTSIAGAIGA